MTRGQGVKVSGRCHPFNEPFVLGNALFLWVFGKSVEDMTRTYTRQAALGRMVTAGDVANMVLFAASDLARNVTGQELVVDGLTQALS